MKRSREILFKKKEAVLEVLLAALPCLDAARAGRALEKVAQSVTVKKKKKKERGKGEFLIGPVVKTSCSVGDVGLIPGRAAKPTWAGTQHCQ